MEKFTMPRKLNDIVYILKPDTDPSELIYSLRSVEANFPHRFVWFIGGQPEGLKPDRAVPHIQTGADKWEYIRSSMLKIINEPELSPEFFLFNDDFFVMKKVTGKFVNYIDRELSDRIEELREVHPWLNPYGRTVYKAREELRIIGATEHNFEVHIPMLFEKDKVNTILKCSSPQMRSIYGNLNQVPTKQHTDVKVYDMETVPTDADYISTNDNTFAKGKVGEYIRQTFDKPSRFEI